MPHILFGISGPPQAAGGARPARLTSLPVGAAFGSSSLTYLQNKIIGSFQEFFLKITFAA
jgi:hypothetical protein